MKKNAYSEIKNLDIKTLLGKIKDLRQDLTKLKLEKDNKNVKLSSQKRKDIAQIFTVIQQKKLIENLKEAKK